MESKHSLSLSTGPILSDPSHYRRLVGKLIYLTISRLDLVYPEHILSQFMTLPTEHHLRVVRHVLRYVKSSPAQGIMYSSVSDLQIRVFCDADWAACPITCRSIFGFCVNLGSSVISWKSKK